MKIINFVIAVFRFFYAVLGVLLLMAVPFTAMVPDGVDFALTFVFVLGLGIMFLRMQHMLKKENIY